MHTNDVKARRISTYDLSGSEARLRRLPATSWEVVQGLATTDLADSECAFYGNLEQIQPAIILEQQDGFLIPLPPVFVPNELGLAISCTAPRPS